jgi:hypothetical protein
VTEWQIAGRYFESCNCDAICPCRRINGVPGGRSGRLGGDALAHFPWAWKESNLLGVRSVAIEVSHEPRRQWLRIRDLVTVSIRGAWPGPETVSCVILGHERRGEELVADRLFVDDDGLGFSYAGNCGYASSFDYRG